MKIAKRILAIALTVIMIVGTCAVAASAAGSLQAAIDAADGSYTLTSNVTESIVIDKDFILDLGGHSIQGERGKVAITINGANVTIINGRVVSRFADVSSAEMIKTVRNQSPCAIRVNGGSLTITGVSVSGGMTRIPTQKKYSVVTGSAVEALNGATVMLNQATLAGRYGVNNAVTGASKGGKVYVNDAVIVGFIRGIRTNEVVSEDTVKVNAADHLNGLFNNGKKLTDREIGLIKTVLGDRVYAYTKKVYSDAVVTITEGSATAKVTASVDDTNVWENRYSTACSYKYIPEYAVLSDGSKVAMTSADGVNYTADVPAALAKDGVKVTYRTWAELQSEFVKYVTNFRAYLTKAYNILCDKLDYTWFCNKFDSVMDMICDLWKTIDELPNPENNGELGFAIADSAEFKALQKALFNLGGAVMVNGNQPYDETESKYYIGYGQRLRFTDDPDVIKDAYAPLDSICQLKDEFEAMFGTLEDESMWGEIVEWAYSKMFCEGGLEDICYDAKDALHNLINVLEDDTVAQIVDLAGFTAKVDQLKTVTEYVDMAASLWEELQATNTGSKLLASLEANQSELSYYVDKAVYVYHNLDEYVTPENFVNGKDLKCWSASAEAEIVVEDAPVKVETKVEGEGIVVCENQATNSEMTTTHTGEVTMTAEAMPNVTEFLYWTNNAGNIISTEPDLTLITKIDREVTAHFGYVDEPTITFASAVGNVVAEKSYVPGAGDIVDTSDVPAIKMAGMIFENWPGDTGSGIDVDALTVSTDYVGGGASAFEKPGTSYSKDGHVLAYRPGSQSLILIPAFDADDVCSLTYVDNGATETVDVKFGQTVTYTASGDDFAYWVDDMGRVVGLSATYTHQAVRTAEFTAVYGAEAPDCAINIVAEKDNSGKTTFYAQRTVKNGLKLLSSGIVVAPAGVAEEDIVVNSTNPAVKKGISRNTANDGTYAVTLNRMTYPEVTLRPFVEIEGIGIVYGECYSVGAVG